MPTVPDDFYETFCKKCLDLQRIDDNHCFCARIQCPHMTAYLHAQEKKRKAEKLSAD